MDSNLLATKSIERLVSDVEHGAHLKRALSGVDLTLMGIGAIIGTGIFVLTGTAAANQAGPAITMSYMLAGLACGFAAMCYAEFASMIPVAGSAYTYSYATLGEVFAWMIGWDLILEYAVGSMTVAIGWSGYFQRILAGFGLHLPAWMAAAPPAGIVNLPAIVIVLAISGLLVVGVRESARFNAVMVAIEIVVVCAAVIVLRVKRPDARRPFRVPCGFLFPILGVAACLYLMLSLSVVTWIRFLVWLDIGMVIYWSYGRVHSPLANPAEQAKRTMLQALANIVTISGVLVLFNGVFMAVLGYMTEFGITTEATAKWHEIHVTAAQADTVGLAVLGCGLVLFVGGLVFRKATGERWERA